MPISSFIFAGPPVDEHDIDRLEQELGFKMPTEYRTFLLRSNGGRPEPEDVFPFGPDQPKGSLMAKFFHVKEGRPSDAIAEQYRSLQGRVPPDLLPVGYDASGSFVCIGIEGKRYGKVYFWSMEDERDWTRWGPSYGNVWEIAENFDDFIAGFYTGAEPELNDEIRRMNGISLKPPSRG